MPQFRIQLKCPLVKLSLLIESTPILVKANISIYAISPLYVSKHGIILGCCPNKKIKNILLMSEIHILKTLTMKVFISNNSRKIKLRIVIYSGSRK